MAMSMKCKLPGCDAPIHVKSAQLCQKHYNRQWHGRPFELPAKPSIEAKFSGSYRKGAENECWPYGGGKDLDGYGIFRHDGKQYRAPRLSWILYRGPIPKGLFVLHSCDNPPCVNPNHLFLGTGKDNSDDMMSKQRWAGSPTTKLTPSQVADIRSRKRTGRHFVRDLSKEFNVSISQIYHVLHGYCWKDDEILALQDKRIGVAPIEEVA